MSRETREWLSQNVLVGFTEQRGKAWHYREGDNNHFRGPVPVGEAMRRLFHWHPVTVTETCECGCGEKWQIVKRSDNGHRMGTFTDGYRPHPYGEWLIHNVSTILGDSLQIGSAGLLRKGAVAWVEVSVPDNIKTPEGVEFRPNLLATTSFDGSIATTYKRVVTLVVCDNTRDLALSENGQQFKVKHTRNSTLRITDAREALAMVHTIAEDFEREVKELIQQEVSARQFDKFLDLYVPLKDTNGEDLTGKSLTMARNKRDKLVYMYEQDERCADWRGTAFGVFQSVNTYLLHESIVRNVPRPERNMLSVITGSLGKEDQKVLSALELALAA